jgi:RHS repeat-associated protein
MERIRETNLPKLLHLNQTIKAYGYDANGNRERATIDGATITASYTLDDNLIVYGDNTYRYDDDGYLIEKTTPDETTTYSYGALGELREVVTPDKTVTYQHNALNQRVAKLVDGTIVEKYLWADLTTLLAVYDAEDNLVQRFEYADGRMPVAMTMGATRYYLHYDQVGSLRAISDTDDNIVKEITYDTYGNILTDSNATLKVPFGFAGGLYDPDTKLTRFGYRDYDAYTGKWTAKDPIGFDGGDSNLYGYVLGDPVRFVDPEGLAAPVVWGIIISIPSFVQKLGNIAIGYYVRKECDRIISEAGCNNPDLCNTRKSISCIKLHKRCRMLVIQYSNGI